MIDRKAIGGKLVRAAAVFTAMLCPLGNLLPKARWDAVSLRRHGTVVLTITVDGSD